MFPFIVAAVNFVGSSLPTLVPAIGATVRSDWELTDSPINLEGVPALVQPKETCIWLSCPPL